MQFLIVVDGSLSDPILGCDGGWKGAAGSSYPPPALDRLPATACMPATAEAN